MPRAEPPAQLDVRFVPWARFLREVKFVPGDHVTLIGRTKSGKTTLAVGGLLPRYRYAVVAGTKRRDPNLYEPLLRRGFILVESARLDYRAHPRVIFRPPLRTLADRERQREHFRLLLEAVYAQGSWALYLDEVRYLSDVLGLRAELDTLWLQGRSLGVTMIAATQEPVSIPRVAFSQIEHLFIWRLTDVERIRRAAELAGSMTAQVRELIPRLSRHEALYVAPSDDLLLRTRFPRAL